MIPFLGEINEKVSKVREFKGDRIKSVRDITESDLQCITLEFDEEYEIMSGLFDVGPYFNMYSQNIIKGVIPSAQFKSTQQNYRHTILLLAFVPDFAGIFDSTNVIAEHDEEGAIDLKNTLQYKLLIICGTFIKVNKKTREQVVWVEETRSVQLQQEEKMQLVDAVDGDSAIAENPNLMAIAIEFRLKPLI